MNDARSFRTLLSIGIHMAHHIVPHFLLPGLCHLVIDVLCMSLQFFDLLIGDDGSAVLGQPQFLLCLCQGDPQLPPGTEFHIGGKQVLHFPAGITLGQGTLISVCTHLSSPSFSSMPDPAMVLKVTVHSVHSNICTQNAKCRRFGAKQSRVCHAKSA